MLGGGDLHTLAMKFDPKVGASRLLTYSDPNPNPSPGLNPNPNPDPDPDPNPNKGGRQPPAHVLGP